ncbi:MAG: AroM family protein [Rhizobiaceae bacterium]
MTAPVRPSLSHEPVQRRRRVACLFAGQTPRNDVTPDLVAMVPGGFEAQELGAMDEMSAGEIEALAARDKEASVLTRLANGSEFVVSRDRITRRMSDICLSLDRSRFDMIAILSTGFFREFESVCPMVNAQRAVESAIDAVAASGQKVGLIYPLERQLRENASFSIPGLSLHSSYFDPYTGTVSADRSEGIETCDVLLLHSVAFSDFDRKRVASLTRKPVISARRVVAGAITLLLGAAAGGHGSTDPTPGAIEQRISSLTPRERQVMSLVAEGLSNKAIARQLGNSPRTVEIHRAKVMEKMDASSTAALIRMVVESRHPAV